MGIVSVNEKKTDRSFGVDERGLYSYRRTWEVTTDRREVGPIAVRNAVPVAVGDVYEYGTSGDDWYERDALSIALRKSGACADADSGLYWLVNVDYGSAEAALIPAADPIQMRPRVRRFSTKYQEPAYWDVLGNPIVNSATDPVHPPPMRTTSHRMMEISRNELVYSDAIAAVFEDRINLDVFYGNDPGTVLCQTIGSEEAFHPIIGPYFIVNYLFELNLLYWNRPILDQGFYKLDADTGERRHILVDGVPATAPVPLDGNGRPFKPGLGLEYYLEYPLYAGAVFALLGLE